MFYHWLAIYVVSFHPIKGLNNDMNVQLMVKQWRECPAHGKTMIECPAHGKTMIECPAHGKTMIECPAHGKTMTWMSSSW